MLIMAEERDSGMVNYVNFIEQQDVQICGQTLLGMYL
jgi:hypothetical protein